ncbi:MAG: MFS transporter, partial [Fluviibacter sp.]
DVVGFVLLIIWVGALQIMLYEGKNLDWFSSPIISLLAVISVIGFVAFLIWEFTEEHPIVDLRVFRHRGFTAAVLTVSLTFAGFFAANVLTPLWLQSFMAYTATDAGMTTAWIGITAFFTAPAVAAMSMKMDPRKLVFFGVLWLGLITMYRAVATTDMSYWDIALPLMLLGLGMPFFFIPSTAAALGSVEEAETNSAAGLMNFMRTLAGAVATSVVTTYWEDEITRNRAELVGVIDPARMTYSQLIDQGMTDAQAIAVLERVVTEQSVMLATNELMLVVSLMLIFSAFVIWLVPKPTRVVDPSTSH